MTPAVSAYRTHRIDLDRANPVEDKGSLGTSSANIPTLGCHTLQQPAPYDADGESSPTAAAAVGANHVRAESIARTLAS